MQVSPRCRSFVPAFSILFLLCCDNISNAWGVPTAASTSEKRKVDTLQLFTHVSPPNSFSVTSTLVYGPTEAVLIDSQFRSSQASALADEIAAKGKKLKANMITQPEEDHYLGTAVLHQRFPATPIYMTAPALANFQTVVEKPVEGSKKFL